MKPRLKIPSLKMNSPPYLKRPAFEASSCQLYFPSVLQYSRCRQSAGRLSLFQLLKKNAHFKHWREMKRSAARALKVTGLCRWILQLRSSGFAAVTDEEKVPPAHVAV